MGKKLPNLKIVSGESQSSSHRPYDIVALDQIDETVRDRIRQAVSNVSKGAGILGVMLGERPWDLRPVIMIFGSRGPSLVRFLGPEVALAKEIADPVRNTLQKICSQNSNENSLGLFEGQVWYRRPLMDRTLDAVVISKKIPTPKEAFIVAKLIVDQVVALHNQGTPHGHLTPSNISLDVYNNVVLLDPMIAVSIVKATRKLGLESFPQGYKEETFAPEVIAGQNPGYSADVYGLGLVFGALFSAVKNSFSAELEVGGDITQADIQAAIDYAKRLQVEEVHRRPAIDDIYRFLESKGRPSEQAEQITETPKVEENLAESGQKKKRRRRRNRNKNTVQGSGLEQSKLDSEFVSESTEEDILEEEMEEASQASDQIDVSRQLEDEKYLAEVKLRAQILEDEPNLRLDHDTPPVSNSLIDAQKSGGLIGTGLTFLFVLVLGLGIVTYLNSEDSTVETPQVEIVYEKDIQTNWESGLRSGIIRVVQKAVSSNEEARGIAATLIIRQALEGKPITDVDIGLIRVAFNKAWETSLTDADRRAVLALASVDLLQDQMPQDLLPPEQLHPGVILALTATYGFEDGAKLNYLNSIPATKLTLLPAPYDGAFRRLVANDPKLTCADPAIAVLARIAMFGVEDPSILYGFLKDQESTVLRLRALSHLSSERDLDAQKILTVILKHPNINITHPNIQWAKNWRIYNWVEFESRDQLAILSGLPPVSKVSDQNITKLLSHPEGVVRGYAINELLERASLKHPASFEVLSALRDNPTELDSKQTVLFVDILINYDTARLSSIRAWLKSEPSISLAKNLVLKTANQKKVASLEVELIQYLRKRDWRPEMSELEIMIKHPQPFVRFYAYNQIFVYPDTDKAVTLLLQARRFETDPEWRVQIEKNINLLSRQTSSLVNEFSEDKVTDKIVP